MYHNNIQHLKEDTILGKIRNVELYNIRRDPEEKRDLFFEEQEKVKELLHRLAFYNSTQVPVNFPKGDKRWIPKDGQAIGPWL